jgi:hypothetical protein
MVSKKALTGLLLILLSLPGRARGQDGDANPSPRHLDVHGLVSASFFLQDRSFGFSNGQSGTFIADKAKTDDPWFLGADSRNTRLRLDLSGLPMEGDWTATAHLEVDFFGGFNGTGAFSDEQAHVRLRHAYLELTRGNTSVVLGQTWAPLLGQVPTSVSHIAFPLGYGSAGVVGWRFPGIQLTRTLESSQAFSAAVKLAAMRGSWSGPGDNLAGESAGEAAAFPQLEARLDLTGKSHDLSWSVYAVAHLDKKDLSGTEGLGENDDGLWGRAVETGGRVKARRVTLQGNAYIGRAIGHQLGQLAQFGDIRSTGAWVQAGYDLTSRWSGWVFMGYGDPDDEDVRALGSTGRLGNRSVAGMLRYRSGPLSLGLEWLGNTTDWAEGASPLRARRGNQFILSALYSF